MMLRFKILLRHLLSIRFANVFLLMRLRGNRTQGLFIPQGKCYLGIHPNALLHVEKGVFFLSKFMRKPEPYVGVLKMGDAATLKVEDDFIIYPGHHIVVMENATLRLGSGYINRNARIHCFQEIVIGKGVAISEHVTLWDTDAHAIIGKESTMTQPIRIGDHVWIGANVTILKGVTIGEGAVIAAGSVVTRSIPPYCLAGGVPAKVIQENIQWK